MPPSAVSLRPSRSSTCSQDPCSVCDFPQGLLVPSVFLQPSSPLPTSSRLCSSAPSFSSPHPCFFETLKVLVVFPSPSSRLRHPQGPAGPRRALQVFVSIAYFLEALQQRTEFLKFPLFVLDFTKVLQRRAQFAQFFFPSWIPWEPLSSLLIIYKISIMLCCINPLLARGGAGAASDRETIFKNIQVTKNHQC